MGWEPARERGRWIPFAAAVVVVLVAVVALRTRGPSAGLRVEERAPDPAVPLLTPQPSGEAIIRSGPWTTIPGAPIPGREDHTAVWTGTEVLFWGGNAREAAESPATGDVLNPQADGAAYDPQARRWRRIPPAPIAPRSRHTTVWTGAEMLVWGGSAQGGLAADGAAWDPLTANWRLIAPSPLAPRNLHSAVWTGEEMLVWGGRPSAGEGPVGAAYDPVADTWRALPEAPIAERLAHAAVWTGSELLIWGGYAGATQDFPSEGAAYDPAADTWRLTAASPLAGRTLHSAVWDGERMDVWGGSLEVGGERIFTDGARYDPAADAWELLPDSGLTPRFGADAAWTGSELVIWGGVGRDFFPDGAAYRPATGRWRLIPAAPVTQPVRYPSAWTGTQLVAWAGTLSPAGVTLDP